MNLNDIVRRLRYILEYSDDQMIQTFAEGDLTVSREQLSNWLKKDEDEAFCPISDQQLAHFLNGLIIVGRGRRDGPQPVAETHLSNNAILMKLRIAFNQQSDDILALLANVDFAISKHELSALFRSPSHKHYRPCQAQLLRRYLMALQLHYRKDSTEL